MNLGFDSSNLNAAVKLVMSLAVGKGQQRLAEVEAGRGYVDLTDFEQVKDYLMRTSEAAYSRAGRGVVAQIRDVVYYSVGVVFEENRGEMHPPPICRSLGRPAHLAYFWQVL